MMFVAVLVAVLLVIVACVGLVVLTRRPRRHRPHDGATVAGAGASPATSAGAPQTSASMSWAEKDVSRQPLAEASGPSQGHAPALERGAAIQVAEATLALAEAHDSGAGDAQNPSPPVRLPIATPTDHPPQTAGAPPVSEPVVRAAPGAAAPAAVLPGGRERQSTPPPEAPEDAPVTRDIPLALLRATLEQAGPQIDALAQRMDQSDESDWPAWIQQAFELMDFTTEGKIVARLVRMSTDAHQLSDADAGAILELSQYEMEERAYLERAVPPTLEPELSAPEAAEIHRQIAVHVLDLLRLKQAGRGRMLDLLLVGDDDERTRLIAEARDDQAMRASLVGALPEQIRDWVEYWAAQPTKVSARGTLPQKKDEVYFSAFYHRNVTIGTSHELLVYAHIKGLREYIYQRAEHRLEEKAPLTEAPSTVTMQSPKRIALGTEVTLTPLCQGVTFTPSEITFAWQGAWHQAAFQFTDDGTTIKSKRFGEVVVLLNNVATLKLPIELKFSDQHEATTHRTHRVEVSGTMVKCVFISYSRGDEAVVNAVSDFMESVDCQVLSDHKIPPGVEWEKAIHGMIDAANLFQLFWSARAAQSSSVRKEWEYALATRPDPGFIHPVYWELPLVDPPPELNKIQFHRVRWPSSSTHAPGS